MSERFEAHWLRMLPLFLRARLAGRSNVQAVIANSGWLLFDKMVRLGLGLLVSAWVARYLGPAQYGEIAYVLAYIAFFQAVANLGADGIVVRDIARAADVAPQILGTAFALRFATGALCWVAAVGGVMLMDGLYHPNVVLTALAGGALVFQAADTADLWFQSQSQSRRTVVAKLAAYLLSSCAKVVLILAQAPLVAFAAVMAFDALAAALGLTLAYRSFPAPGRWQVVGSQARRLIRESWPFMFSGVSIMIYMRIDQIMIKEMLGDEALGLYAAILPLSQLWHLIPMTLATSLAPVIARKKSQGPAAYDEALLRVFRVFGGLALLVSTLTALAAPLVVSQLYGTAYVSAAPILALHVFTNLFVFQGVAQGLWLANEGVGRIALYKTGLGGVTAILANIMLLPILGLQGAAISAIISFGVSAFLSNALFAPKILLMQLGINPKAYQ